MHKLIKLEKNYNLNYLNQIKEFYSLDYIYVPVKKNYFLLVKKGDIVLKNQIILENNLNKILCPVSGKVIDFVNKNVDGILTKVVVIENDYKEKEKCIIRKSDVKFEKEYIVSKLYDFYFKYFASILEQKKINNLIVVTYNDEPYIKNNMYITSKYSKEILEMIDILSTTFNIQNTIISMKSNDDNNIEKYLGKIGTYPNISLSLVEDYYLLEKPFFLLEYMHLKDFDSLVLDSKTLLEMHYAIKYSKFMHEVFITIAGPNINKSTVIETKIGANLFDIINNTISVKENSEYILNGLMTGSSCDPKETVISKNSLGVIIIPKDSLREEKCNMCGLCYKVCPVKVNPKAVMDSKKVSSNCFDCGLCSYICPCHINLRKFLRSEHE